jgi:hypothetical protein
MNLQPITAGLKAYLTRLNKTITAEKIDEIRTLSSQIKDRHYNWEYQVRGQDLLAKYVTKTTWESFCRFGDRNQKSEQLILCWIRTKGMPLDIQAAICQEETGVEYSPSDFAEFIAQHPGGARQYRYHQETFEMEELFKELTGFRWSHKLNSLLHTKYFPGAAEIFASSLYCCDAEYF